MLLFDENISYRILKKIDFHFPASKHISYFSKQTLKDIQIFGIALKQNYSIVSFDEDFFELQILKGFPPKLIWLRFGNFSTQQIADSLIDKKQQILEFLTNDELGVFEMYI
jgi:predicted nuclease of predicted toxin-antitoxin system